MQSEKVQVNSENPNLFYYFQLNGFWVNFQSLETILIFDAMNFSYVDHLSDYDKL